MTEEKTAIEEEKKKKDELELQEMTADDLAAGTALLYTVFRKKMNQSRVFFTYSTI